MRGFLLITVLVLTLLIGGVILSFFQQSIQQRFQSQAFLESQILFQELNGVVVQVQNYLQKFSPNNCRKIRLCLKVVYLQKVLKTGQEILKHPEAIC